jgi:MFS family permease
METRLTQDIEFDGENMLTTDSAAKDHACLGWVVVLAASLFFFYEFIQLNLFNAIDVDLMRAFGLNALQLGQLSSMYFYANALCLFPAGMLLDRFSTKKLLLVAVIFCTVGTFIFSLATHYFVAALARFLVGMGASFCFLSCIRLASRWFPANKMAFVTGVVVTMAMLGGLVAQTPFALLSQHLGWRTAVLIDAGLGIIIGGVIALLVQDRPPNTHEEHQADKQHLKNLGLWQCIVLVLSNRNNWFGGIYTSLLNLPVFLLGALWGIHYLVQVNHLSSVQASYATTTFFLGVIFGSPAFGWLSDHIGRRILPMVLGAIASLVVIMILLYVPNLSLSGLITLFFLMGFVTSSQVLSYPVIAELNPISLTSTAVSIASIVIMCSGAIFQPLFGWIMQLHWDGTVVNNVPIYSAQDFNYAMLVMPVAFVVGLVIAFLIKETYCQGQSK